MANLSDLGTALTAPKLVTANHISRIVEDALKSESVDELSATIRDDLAEVNSELVRLTNEREAVMAEVKQRLEALVEEIKSVNAVKRQLQLALGVIVAS